MDLGAGICSPRQARCDLCPVGAGCSARLRPDPTDLPVKPAKAAKPVRRGNVLIIINEQHQLVMTQRPPTGLLGGMMGFPSDGWDQTDPDPALQAALAGRPARRLSRRLHHTFTHFTADLQISLYQVKSSLLLPPGFEWSDITPDDWPSLFSKAWHIAASDNSLHIA